MLQHQVSYLRRSTAKIVMLTISIILSYFLLFSISFFKTFLNIFVIIFFSCAITLCKTIDPVTAAVAETEEAMMLLATTSAEGMGNSP